jgi:hypothetical protein
MEKADAMINSLWRFIFFSLRFIISLTIPPVKKHINPRAVFILKNGLSHSDEYIMTPAYIKNMQRQKRFLPFPA